MGGVFGQSYCLTCLEPPVGGDTSPPGLSSVDPGCIGEGVPPVYGKAVARLRSRVARSSLSGKEEGKWNRIRVANSHTRAPIFRMRFCSVLNWALAHFVPFSPFSARV